MPKGIGYGKKMNKKKGMSNKGEIGKSVIPTTIKPRKKINYKHKEGK